MFVDCLFGRHRPDRQHVRYDGEVFRGRCKSCGARLVRLETGCAPEHRFPPRAPAKDDEAATMSMPTRPEE